MTPSSFRAPHWTRRLFEPVDIASLIYLRIAFGGLMLWELWRYAVGRKVTSLWIIPEFHFKYFGFEWVAAPPDRWIYVLFLALAAGAIGIAMGLCYRFSAVVFALGFAWLFLIDTAQYLNHFYLICLLGFLSILLPANRCWAVDVLRRPGLRSDVAPAWTLWLVRAQVAMVYFYGGIAKLNQDWLRGEPIRTWLGWRARDSWLGDLLRSEWTVGVISYGGLFFDVAVVPLLLWRKTRLFAFILATGFHLTNNWLFNIGVFPWLAIALTAMFFPPEWPRRWLEKTGAWKGRGKGGAKAVINLAQYGFAQRRTALAFLGFYLAWQLLMPLRHLLYPGAVSWTEEGHRFSWHMKLRSKDGETKFFVLDPRTQEVWALNSLAYLTMRQQRKMNGHPDMILQFAQHIGGLMSQAGRTNVHIHVIADARLNGRSSALLIDPNVNLMAVRRSLRPATWILPLENKAPLPAWYVTNGPAPF